MWHWDQGRLGYFQFDVLRVLSHFALDNDFKAIDNQKAKLGTGLPFLPQSYMPWRNYSRVLKLSMIVSERNGIAVPTPVAVLLARTGAVTCDEYMHFLIQTFTDHSPALRDWCPDIDFRFPLVFALKYLLTKNILTNGKEGVASFDEIIGAYIESGFYGGEGEEDFILLIQNRTIDFSSKVNSLNVTNVRQAKESLKVISQISYLHCTKEGIVVSLVQEDAEDIFRQIEPLQGGERADSANEEIFRLSNLFKGGSALEFFDYKNTIVNDVLESGFVEGNKVKKTHVTIERNSKLRKSFFIQNPSTVCDACSLDTKKKYCWTERVLDLHHLLPLSSGTRVEAKGTLLSDLVAVCPTCHRAIHRYYDTWLTRNQRVDFESQDEAVQVYKDIKVAIEGGQACLH